MKRQPEKPGIIPALALTGDVQNQCFAGAGTLMVEEIDPALSLPDDHLARASDAAWHFRDTQWILKSQCWISLHNGPVPKRRRHGWKDLIKIRADSRTRDQSVLRMNCFKAGNQSQQAGSLPKAMIHNGLGLVTMKA